MNDIKQLLEQIHELRCAVDAAKLERDALIDGLLTAEQRTQLREIRDEFEERIEHTLNRIDDLDQQVRVAVRQHGESVKTDHLHAVYVQPSPTWDSEGLLAMSKNPEFVWLREFMRESAPRVQIRIVK